MDALIGPMSPDDWPSVVSIYRDGIRSGDATFETEAPSWEAWDAARLSTPRLVARAPGGEVLGFACLSPTSSRPVYAGVAEVMVYVAERARGRGIGGRLLGALVEASEEAGIWTLHAGIFPENVASIRAHERVGFRILGRAERAMREGARSAPG